MYGAFDCMTASVQSNALYREVLTTQLNYLASLAKWLSVRLQAKWLWVRVPSQSLKWSLFCENSSNFLGTTKKNHNKIFKKKEVNILLSLTFPIYDYNGRIQRQILTFLNEY